MFVWYLGNLCENNAYFCMCDCFRPVVQKCAFNCYSCKKQTRPPRHRTLQYVHLFIKSFMCHNLYESSTAHPRPPPPLTIPRLSLTDQRAHEVSGKFITNTQAPLKAGEHVRPGAFIPDEEWSSWRAEVLEQPHWLTGCSEDTRLKSIRGE